MSKPVVGLMYLLGPVAWPTAKLLDWILGEDHGTVYKKSGLKTLVTLHKSLGELSDRLNQDEVTIITAVLDLKDKPVSEVMTPMDDVFTMSEDHILDEKTMDKILSLGYSRIPIYRTGNPTDFVGIMLVKTLITYDPEDRIPVREVPLGAIVETRPETSCLDIINFFQEGKSHMVLVSEYPGADHGALGVVTLEDVIEELIGECVVLNPILEEHANTCIEKLLMNLMFTSMFTKPSGVSLLLPESAAFRPKLRLLQPPLPPRPRPVRSRTTWLTFSRTRLLMTRILWDLTVLEATTGSLILPRLFS